MKITKEQLNQIIEEEIQSVVGEGKGFWPWQTKANKKKPSVMWKDPETGKNYWLSPDDPRVKKVKEKLEEGPEEQYGSSYQGPGYYVMDFTAIYEGPYASWDEAQAIADSEGMRVQEIPAKEPSFSPEEMERARLAKIKFGLEEAKKAKNMKITKKHLKQLIKEELSKVLEEGTVVADGLTVYTKDPASVSLTLEGEPLTYEQIFNDLNDNHVEWQGWKDNWKGDPNEFYSDHIIDALDDWAEMRGHRVEKPDMY